MGLLDSLKSTFTSSGEASVPPSASFATREGVIYAPVNGVLVNLDEVPDETIAAGMLGQGYGIEPITDTIYAPANGRIGALSRWAMWSRQASRSSASTARPLRPPVTRTS